MKRCFICCIVIGAISSINGISLQTQLMQLQDNLEALEKLIKTIPTKPIIPPPSGSISTSSVITLNQPKRDELLILIDGLLKKEPVISDTLREILNNFKVLIGKLGLLYSHLNELVSFVQSNSLKIENKDQKTLKTLIKKMEDLVNVLSIEYSRHRVTGSFFTQLKQQIATNATKLFDKKLNDASLQSDRAEKSLPQIVILMSQLLSLLAIDVNKIDRIIWDTLNTVAITVRVGATPVQNAASALWRDLIAKPIAHDSYPEFIAQPIAGDPKNFSWKSSPARDGLNSSALSQLVQSLGINSHDLALVELRDDDYILYKK